MHGSSLEKAFFETLTTTFFAGMKKRILFLEISCGITGANELTLETSLICFELMNSIVDLMPDTGKMRV
jgi:hypothetical protein